MIFLPANRILLNRLLLFAVLFLIAVITLVFIISNSSPDEKVFNAIAPHISASRTSFMKNISFIGNHRFLIPANLIFIAYLISRKNKWGAITAAFVALSSLGLMSLLKNLVRRHRPENSLVDGITNYSFPSGHALMGVAFYGLLICWAVSAIKVKLHRQLVIAFLFLLLFIVGFSRIYLRVHYTTDVIAGYCIGTIWLFFCLWLINKIEPASGFVPEH